MRFVLLGCDPLPDWDWDWVALGWPKGGPSVAQGPRMGHASVELNKCFVCNIDGKKAGWGEKRSPESHDIADIARHRKSKSYH